MLQWLCMFMLIVYGTFSQTSIVCVIHWLTEPQTAASDNVELPARCATLSLCSLRRGMTTSLHSSSICNGWQHQRRSSSSSLFLCTSVCTRQHRTTLPMRSNELHGQSRGHSTPSLSLSLRRTRLSIVSNRAFLVTRTWNSLPQHVISALYSIYLCCPNKFPSSLSSSGFPSHDFHCSISSACRPCTVTFVIFRHFNRSFYLPALPEVRIILWNILFWQISKWIEWTSEESHWPCAGKSTTCAQQCGSIYRLWSVWHRKNSHACWSSKSGCCAFTRRHTNFNLHTFQQVMSSCGVTKS